MTKDELKDVIRETFPDTSIKNAVDRFIFIVGELSHAYVNIIKEILAKWLGEDLADEIKYILGYGLPAIILFWILV